MSYHEKTAREKAEKIIRRNFTPGYPMDKPFSEMTPFENGFFNHWTPVIAAALAHAEAEANERGFSVSADLEAARAEIARLKAEVERLEGMLTEEYKACRIKAEQELSQELADEVSQLKAENLRLSHEGLLVEKQAAEAERDYFKSKLAEAEREVEKWLAWSNGQQPDDSTGDVIAAYGDGTIILDDSIATWNPLRALKFMHSARDAAEAKGVRIVQDLIDAQRDEGGPCDLKCGCSSCRAQVWLAEIAKAEA